MDGLHGVVKIEARNDDFPLNVLQEGIRQFVQEGAGSLPGPVELVAIPALVATAAAIGSARVIQFKEGWIEPSSLWAAVVSPTGAMRSPALKMAAESLQDLDTKDRRTWTSDVTV